MNVHSTIEPVTRIGIGATCALAVLAGLAPGQSTTRVSTTPVNSQANYHSFFGAVSADGRYVAFQSLASNLSLVDVNFHVPDIFVKDTQTGNTILVSVDSNAVQGNSGSLQPTISADGRFVAFESESQNLVASDTNAVRDVFVHDMQTGATERVSVASSGAQSSGPSYVAVISADGRYVAFESDAADLVPGDTNGVRDVFVHDRTTGVTVRASTDSGGVEGDGASSWPTISGDGRYVGFESLGANLVPGDTNGVLDVFRKDLQTGALVRVSVDSAGAQAALGGDDPTISADGRCVAFTSVSADLVAGDTNGVDDVYVRDMQTGATTRVSVSSAGVQADAACLIQGSCQISADGRYVAFDSAASTLVAGDVNAGSDVFVHDRATGTTVRVDVSTAGTQANSNARSPSISLDGRFVVFESSATNLVAGDNNLMWDVFRRDRGPSNVETYCFGDGSGAACPCGNSGSAGNGCANSVNPGGASLVGAGTTRVGADTFALVGAGMPNSSALYFQGTTAIEAAFGDGLRCTGGVVVRLGTKSNASGASTFPSAGDPSISVRGMVLAGDVRTYQCWYRNAAAYCTPSTFNLTNGCRVTWSP